MIAFQCDRCKDVMVGPSFGSALLLKGTAVADYRGDAAKDLCEECYTDILRELTTPPPSQT